MPVRRIVSGGQTGVDRAALDAARALGIPVGGWCPRGGWAEDGVDVRTLYPELRATPSEDPAQRTRWNVRDSDATLVLTRSDASSPGTDVALETARSVGRPLRVVLLDSASSAADVKELLRGLDGTVSVGGPRESEAPGIGGSVYHLLTSVLPEFLP